MNTEIASGEIRTDREGRIILPYAVYKQEQIYTERHKTRSLPATIGKLLKASPLFDVDEILRDANGGRLKEYLSNLEGGFNYWTFSSKRALELLSEQIAVTSREIARIKAMRGAPDFLIDLEFDKVPASRLALSDNTGCDCCGDLVSCHAYHNAPLSKREAKRFISILTKKM